MSKIKCYSCNQLGHYARDCTQENKKRKKKHHAHMMDVDEATSYNKSKETSDGDFSL